MFLLQLRVGVALQEILALPPVFFVKQRAGGQEHPAAGFERLPQAVEQDFLLPCGLGGIVRAAQPFDVGIALDGA